MKSIALVKTLHDVHTLGIMGVSEMIKQCGYYSVIGDDMISEAIERIEYDHYYSVFKNWLVEKQVYSLGLSYRLDPQNGKNIFGKLVHYLKNDRELWRENGGYLERVFFAGLPEACRSIELEFKNEFSTFDGNDDVVTVLKRIGIEENKIPNNFLQDTIYDKARMEFGRRIIEKESYQKITNLADYSYKKYGTFEENISDRIINARKRNKLPLYRSHIGPYDEDRNKALLLFNDWLKDLAKERLLDIVSIGSSQLSQSHFGENWDDMPNGGGVPFNSEIELHNFWMNSRPLLLRAYSGTKNVKEYSEMLDNTINCAWHALSIWWFNEMDGRGSLTVRESIRQHTDTIASLAVRGRSLEINTSHHFAFRGGDDVTYVLSEYIAAKVAKQYGIKFFVLQNMLNTPKYISGKSDLVKARATLRLLRQMEDETFRVVYQPRAGLDYFSPDEEKAKCQLAAVSALMADIEPENIYSPELIHIVGYSEALYLANPEVINESIKITEFALKEWKNKKHGSEILDDELLNKDVNNLISDVTLLLNDIEKNIINPYTPEGLYMILKKGYFAIPYLWNCREEFHNAVKWKTALIDGGIKVVDENNYILTSDKRIQIIHNTIHE